MEQVIDPLIADLQREHGDALRDKRAWRSRWIHTAGCVVFWKVMAIEAGERSVFAIRDYARDDDGALARVAACSGAALLVVLSVHMLSWTPAIALVRGSDRLRSFVFFMPAGLAVSIQVALCVGIATALRLRDVSRRVRRRVATFGVVCTLVAFCNGGWVLPASNQAFRELMAGRRVAKGANELTLSELRASRFTFAYHIRLAIIVAPLTHTLFALVLVTRRRGRWAVTTTIIASVLYLAYDTVLAGSGPLHFDTWTVIGIAWTPNLILAAASVALSRPIFSSPRTPSTAG